LQQKQQIYSFNTINKAIIHVLTLYMSKYFVSYMHAEYNENKANVMCVQLTLANKDNLLLTYLHIMDLV